MSIFESHFSSKSLKAIGGLLLSVLSFASGPPESMRPVFTPEKTFYLNDSPGFHDIRAFDVDAGGWLCVLDQGLKRVFVFNDQGKLIADINGKNAKEPFGRASGVAMGIKDEIAVCDYGHTSVLYFSKEGKFLRQFIRKDICLYGLAVLSDGKIVAKTTPLDGGPFRIESWLLTADLDGIFRRGSVLSPQQGNTIDAFWIPSIWKIGPSDTLFYSRPTDYKIQAFNSDGQWIRDIVKTVPPLRITEKEKQEALKKFVPPGYQLKFPEYHSAFQDFSVDDKGNVFVRTWETDTKSGSYLFDVFDDKGRQIGRFPLNINPVRWMGGKMYAIEGSDSGSQIIRRYAVTWGTDPREK